MPGKDGGCQPKPGSAWESLPRRPSGPSPGQHQQGGSAAGGPQHPLPPQLSQGARSHAPRDAMSVETAGSCKLARSALHLREQAGTPADARCPRVSTHWQSPGPGDYSYVSTSCSEHKKGSMETSSPGSPRTSVRSCGSNWVLCALPPGGETLEQP